MSCWRNASVAHTLRHMTNNQNPVGWRLPSALRREVAAYAAQTRRSAVGSAEVLIQNALRSAARSGEYRPEDPELPWLEIENRPR